MILECTLSFEAAHRNTSADADERVRRLHGHSYEVMVSVVGAIDPAIGWVMDFGEIKDKASVIVDHLDHRILNDIDGMRDTTRADVTSCLTAALRPALPSLHECRVTILGDRDWSPRISRLVSGGECLRFGFDAAHFLPTLPEAHKCRRVHGHSFRVAVASPDASRLASPLFDIHERLDHRLLNDLPGLENPTSEMLAEWLRNELERRRCVFDEIMVAETCTSCCRLEHP
jgi:6-pyruvoyltetrahydropterin/6-carboxytetrahydropterin synthase